MAVEGGIPQPPRAVVAAVAGREQLALEAGAQIVQVGGLECQLPAVESQDIDGRPGGEQARPGQGGGGEYGESPRDERSSFHETPEGLS